ncbi:hypothetical protein J1N35_018687 [Gossypium stocksii]|uniref:C3H1-type domain-containing protein n=1 Tax=Gossypium stocksii TaxID=47602 RepID=A0A9D3VRH6_9ROSI|nr:hypothetical protein J1N35_018687 [Gossypium stocksii]
MEVIFVLIIWLMMLGAVNIGKNSLKRVGQPDCGQDEKSYPHFMRTGSCKFGVACKLHHPQLATAGIGLPVNGCVGSSILPPIGVPYASGLPTWSLFRAPFFSGLHLQTQSYMPVVVSPSQNIILANGWTAYMTLVRYKLPIVVSL